MFPPSLSVYVDYTICSSLGKHHIIRAPPRKLYPSLTCGHNRSGCVTVIVFENAAETMLAFDLVETKRNGVFVVRFSSRKGYGERLATFLPDRLLHVYCQYHLADVFSALKNRMCLFGFGDG